MHPDATPTWAAVIARATMAEALDKMMGQTTQELIPGMKDYLGDKLRWESQTAATRWANFIVTFGRIIVPPYLPAATMAVATNVEQYVSIYIAVISRLLATLETTNPKWRALNETMLCHGTLDSDEGTGWISCHIFPTATSTYFEDQGREAGDSSPEEAYL